MASGIPLPELTARDGREAMEVLLEQERILRYEGTFGSKEALRLGLAAVEAAASAFRQEAKGIIKAIAVNSETVFLMSLFIIVPVI